MTAGSGQYGFAACLRFDSLVLGLPWQRMGNAGIITVV